MPADEIAPSTLLAPYTRRYSGVFLGSVSQLAPGALPLVRIRVPAYDAAIFGIMAGILCLLVGYCSGSNLFGITGLVVLVAAYALTWVAARVMLPASVEFGELRTFRDMAKALAEGGHA